jgi:zinc-ribbon domain
MYDPDDSYEDDVDDDSYEDDYDDDDSSGDFLPCSHCGAEIYEDSVSCPQCGEYITRNSHPLADRPWWWLALGVLGIVALLASLLVF